MSNGPTPLQVNRIHRALSRPGLLLGGDRELVLLSGLVSIILIFVVLTWYAATIGLIVWTIAVSALRAMAKADPSMRQVYLRHVRYNSTYRATSTPWRR